MIYFDNQVMNVILCRLRNMLSSAFAGDAKVGKSRSRRRWRSRRNRRRRTRRRKRWRVAGGSQPSQEVVRELRSIITRDCLLRVAYQAHPVEVSDPAPPPKEKKGRKEKKKNPLLAAAVVVVVSK